MEFGLLNDLAAEMFALVVFFTDGFLQINGTTPSPAARLFSIAARLPMELQMVMCFRQLGSEKEIIPGAGLEMALSELEWKLW